MSAFLSTSGMLTRMLSPPPRRAPRGALRLLRARDRRRPTPSSSPRRYSDPRRTARSPAGSRRRSRTGRSGRSRTTSAGSSRHWARGRRAALDAIARLSRLRRATRSPASGTAFTGRRTRPRCSSSIAARARRRPAPSRAFFEREQREEDADVAGPALARRRAHPGVRLPTGARHAAPAGGLSRALLLPGSGRRLRVQALEPLPALDGAPRPASTSGSGAAFRRAVWSFPPTRTSIGSPAGSA